MTSKIVKTFSHSSNVKYNLCLPCLKNIFYTNLTFLWHVISELSTIMCFSQFLWPWPLTYFCDISWQCRYHTQLPPYQVCNNRPTFNEVIVWHRAADTHIHTHTGGPSIIRLGPSCSQLSSHLYQSTYKVTPAESNPPPSIHCTKWKVVFDLSKH